MEEKKIIKLTTGCRYELINGDVYSLNYAERGMCGSTLGKKMPDHLAASILSEHRRNEDWRAAREKKRASVKVRAKETPLVKKSIEVEAKPKKKKAAIARKKKLLSGAVSLSNLFKNSGTM